jgi:hypothetical protein
MEPDRWALLRISGITQWMVIACQDRCVRMIHVKYVLPQSLSSRISSFMDSPEAVSITLFIIIVDLLSGTVTVFGIPEKDKDCFGRDSLDSFYIHNKVHINTIHRER